MSKDLISNIAELQVAVKNYAQNKIDLIQLSIVEKASRIFSTLISSLVVILMSVLIIGFGTTAFVVWYHQTYNNLFDGLFIGIGFLIVLLVLFILLRNKIITSFMVRYFSEILIDEEDDK
jgi:hypothetical protein